MFSNRLQWSRGGLVFEAHKTLVSLSLRIKDLLGPVTRVKKKRSTKEVAQDVDREPVACQLVLEPSGTVLKLKSTTSHQGEAGPRRARV